MSKTRGIIVGLNAKIEYLLPFFYTNLRLHTDLPITFFDFGMSLIGRQFCQKRGEVIAIDETLFSPPPDEVGFFEIKKAWFKKPLACLLAPYSINLWIDLDCLIKAPLDDIFEAFDEKTDLVMVKEYEIDVHVENLSINKIPVYNSGVMAFRQKASIIDTWIARCKTSDLRVSGDQDILSFCLYDHPDKFKQLPAEYNFVLKTKDSNIAHDISLSNDLEIIDPMSFHAMTPSSAFIIHFAGQMKNQMLARSLELEKLASQQATIETSHA